MLGNFITFYLSDTVQSAGDKDVTWPLSCSLAQRTTSRKTKKADFAIVLCHDLSCLCLSLHRLLPLSEKLYIPCAPLALAQLIPFSGLIRLNDPCFQGAFSDYQISINLTCHILQSMLILLGNLDLQVLCLFSSPMQEPNMSSSPLLPPALIIVYSRPLMNQV